MTRTSSFRGRLLKESNSNQCCGDKGGVVLAETTVTLLSLGKLRRLTPDACSPKPQRIGSFQVGRAPGKRLWSHTTSPPLLGKSPNLDFSHLKNGNNINFTGLFCGVDNIIMSKCYVNVQRLTLVLVSGSFHLYPLPFSSSSWVSALLWD